MQTVQVVVAVVALPDSSCETIRQAPLINNGACSLLPLSGFNGPTTYLRSDAI
jgi:hypothetical protein